MVAELKKALKEAEKLSREKQKAVADLILDEIKWDSSFQNSQSELASLAQEALGDYKSKKTRPLKLD